MVELKTISTEARNQNTMDIDLCSTEEILRKINNEDKTVPLAVEKTINEITKVVNTCVKSINDGGRIIYLGAGTSGRIGILDAVECPPTFGVSYELVKGVMAGGSSAFIKAIEGAEDSKELAVDDLKNINLSKNDIVIGIAASGRTPYVIGGIEYANQINASTACITTSLNSPLEKIVDTAIVAYTGPEAITGSTRMKSGTAQKLICNMISSTTMIKLGKVYENLMVDVKPTNEKLISRSINIIKEALGISKEEATSLYKKYNNVKVSILSGLTNIEDETKLKELLEQAKGNIRIALKNSEA